MIRVCPKCKKRYRYAIDRADCQEQTWWCHSCWRDWTNERPRHEYLVGPAAAPSAVPGREE